MVFVKSPVTPRVSMPAFGRIAAILTLGLQLSACHLPSWQTGQLRVATRFASREVQSQSLRIQAIPAESSAITVAVFKLGTQGQPEQSVLLTPAHASHELGQLEPGPRRVLALAFDNNGRLLAGSSGQAQVIAGQTSQLSLELSTSFSPDAQELANLKALLPKPADPLSGSQTSQQTHRDAAQPSAQPSSPDSGKHSQAPGQSPLPAPLAPGQPSGNPLAAVTEQIRDSAGTILDPATQTVDNLAEQVSSTVGSIGNTVGNTVGSVSDAVNDTSDAATGAVNDSVDSVTDTVDQVGGSGGGPVGELIDDTSNTVDETVDDTIDAVDETVDTVASAIPSLIPSILPTPTPTPSPTPTPKPSPTPLLGIKLPLG